MSTTPDQIAQSMLATLSSTCPGLSCELGTPERKILDAVAQAISLAYVSNYLTGSLLDIETKTGLELDQFVGTFGFGRLQGKPAKGVVTIELTTPLNQDYIIQSGTQFYTKPNGSSANSVYFAATQQVVMSAGTYSVDVPVKCTTTGVGGNVAPDSITFMASTLGSSSCTNLQPMTGGVDVETDDELRHRFENTLLRNVSGTEDWYKALCLQNDSVSRVAVYGPTSTYRTQIEVPALGSEVSLPINRSTRSGAGTDVSYVWPGMQSVFVDLAQNNETFYNGTYDYNLTSGPSPKFKALELGSLTPGDILDVEFQYTSSASRNDPTNGLTNKVDVYVDGSSPFTVTEVTTVSATTFSSSPTSPFYVNNFERVGTSDTPNASNRFTRLNSCPIISFPDSITIGSSVYTKGQHYWVVRESSTSSAKRRGSMYEVAGIEWAASGGGGSSGPSSNTKITMKYVYNQTPEVLTASMKSSKQICTDVMVHQADYRYILPCFSIQYSHGYDVNTVNTAIINRLQLFFQNLNFGAWIDTQVLCLAVQQATGVLSVKLTEESEDPTNFGIKVFKGAKDTGFIRETGNFKLADNQIAQFLSVTTRRVPTP